MRRSRIAAGANGSTSSEALFNQQAASASCARSAVGSNVGQRDADVGDACRRDLRITTAQRGRGPVAGLALELLIGPAGAARRSRGVDLAQHLVLCQGGHVGAEEEGTQRRPCGGRRGLAARRTRRSPWPSAGWSLPGSPCAMSPPMVPRLRTWGSAISLAASLSKGSFAWITGELITSVSVVIAPITTSRHPHAHHATRGYG